MKIVIVVLVAITLAFAFVAIQGGTRGGGTPDPCTPPTVTGDQDKDEDAFSQWKPCSSAKLLGAITAPFAPKVKLANPVVALAAHASETRMFSASSSDMRVAQVVLAGKGAMLISASCFPKSGRTCPTPVCICSPGAEFSGSQVSSCPQAWKDRHANGTFCTDDDVKISLTVYPDPGSIAFTALGNDGATAKVAQ